MSSEEATPRLPGMRGPLLMVPSSPGCGGRVASHLPPRCLSIYHSSHPSKHVIFMYPHTVSNPFTYLPLLIHKFLVLLNTVTEVHPSERLIRLCLGVMTLAPEVQCFHYRDTAKKTIDCYTMSWCNGYSTKSALFHYIDTAKRTLDCFTMSRCNDCSTNSALFSLYTLHCPL